MMRILSSDGVVVPEDVKRWQGYSTMLHKYDWAYCLYLIHDLYKTEPCIKLLGLWRRYLNTYLLQRQRVSQRTNRFFHKTAICHNPPVCSHKEHRK